MKKQYRIYKTTTECARYNTMSNIIRQCKSNPEQMATKINDYIFDDDAYPELVGEFDTIEEANDYMQYKEFSAWWNGATPYFLLETYELEQATLNDDGDLIEEELLDMKEATEEDINYILNTYTEYEKEEV